MPPKKISRSSITGARGVALIAQRALEMGFVWHQTDANLEAGIDGIIELRDDATGNLLNTILQVQSRATTGSWASETAEGFNYICTEDELAYWMGGNAPVLLVCSKPDTGEAYWISVKDHFHDLTRRRTRRAHFDKHADRFDAAARDTFLRLGLSRDAGIYFAPPPISEMLLLNLVPVSFPETIWVGDTMARGPGDIWRALGERNDREWVLHGKRVISFHDLSEQPWRILCDQGTVESFPTGDWSESGDSEREQQFVRLLNECSHSKLSLLDLRLFERRRDDRYFYFLPSPDGKPREVHYKSLVAQTSRTVVNTFSGKRDGFSYVRHNAVATQFRRFMRTWHLALTPTYHFTHDGVRIIKRYNRLLAGIKRLERHAAVMGQVVMWAELLRSRPQEGELFPTQVYPFLSTGPLVTLEASAGVNDAAWVSTDDDPPETDELPLFDSDQASPP